MKIIIKNLNNEYFSKKPEVGFVKNKNFAHVFNCINEEHTKIVLEKTMAFTYQENLLIEKIEEELQYDYTKKDEAKKSQKNNDTILCKNV